MSRVLGFAFLAALLLVLPPPQARAEKKTVCTITINSPDEKQAFQRGLPEGDYRFVELVERGRPDWLGSACRKDVRCDVLIVSGHFDDGTEFYSDRLDARESLPVEALERASCSDSCPGLFSQLKEVYLFGCNTLEAAPLRTASAEMARSLVRGGRSPAEAERLSRTLAELHGESNRDRMRHIFADVPVIYGFSAKAPLGRSAGPVLERYFQSGTADEVGTGRASTKLLALFAPASMTSTAGLRASDPDAGVRRDACQLADERLSAAQGLSFVHQLLRRDTAEVRMFLDRIERYMASLGEAERRIPAVAEALASIARDRDARARYLDFARDTDEAATGARMIELAGALGWLSPAEQRSELMHLIGERLARGRIGPAEVDLACSLARKHGLGEEREQLRRSPALGADTGHAAVLACLGDADARSDVLRALAGPDDEDVLIAQTYLRHRPLTGPEELRSATAAVLRMKGSEAQVRALDTLAGYGLSDRDTLRELARLFTVTRSLDVQRAIAGLLIRSDYRAIASPDLARALREHRVKSPGGPDVIDVLIRRVQAS